MDRMIAKAAQTQRTACNIPEKWVTWAKETPSTATTENVPDWLKEAFVRYNTSMPTSAPVERLFSLGKRVLNALRTLLSDVNFEACVMLSFNKHIEKDKKM